MTTAQSYRQRVEQLKGQREALQTELSDCEVKLSSARKMTVYIEQGLTILQGVAEATQDQLEYRVSELTTLALGTVFPQPYDFGLSQSVQRGRSHYEPVFRRDGEEIAPMLASGGGVVDVAAFALRLSLWSLAPHRSRAVFVLDEPFRFVSTGLQGKVCELLHQLAGSLGVQFIIVTHEEQLLGAADRVFQVRLEDGVSQVSSR